MKRHIKAFLITAAILAVFVGLGLTAVVAFAALYMIVLVYLDKDDNEEI